MSQTAPRELESWSRKLEAEWTCAHFAASLQVTPQIAREVLKHSDENLSPVAKARMVIAIALVKRRAVSDLEPLKDFLRDLSKEVRLVADESRSDPSL
mmetsp:Transcript_3271/g.8086  ORF Transcript_3271/g.8086 Transcript_3271/m.8086 type:complete len:98 (-) Transcript_3271:310-603(-)